MPTFSPLSSPPISSVTSKINNEQVAGADIFTTAPGVQLVSIGGATGDAIDTTNSSLNTNITGGSVNIATMVNPSDKIGSGIVASLNDTVVAVTNGCSIVSFNIIGTWSATLTIEATIDGGKSWFAIDGDVDATDTIISTTTANGLVTINCSSYNQVRLRASSYSSGFATITWSANQGLSLVEVFNTNSTSLRVNTQSSPDGTLLNTYSVHLTSNATTTPTAATAYISSISISSEVGGTTSTVSIQDKQGTPLKLVNGFSTTSLTTTPTTINFQTPVKMTSGIDIITAGAVAATIDVWINYYQ